MAYVERSPAFWAQHRSAVGRDPAAGVMTAAWGSKSQQSNKKGISPHREEDEEASTAPRSSQCEGSRQPREAVGVGITARRCAEGVARRVQSNGEDGGKRCVQGT